MLAGVRRRDRGPSAAGGRSHPLPWPPRPRAQVEPDCSSQEVGTYRYLHLKVISVEPEGEVRERPLEKSRWAQDEDKLEVCREGRLQGREGCGSVCGQHGCQPGPHARSGPRSQRGGPAHQSGRFQHANVRLKWKWLQTLHC